MSKKDKVVETIEIDDLNALPELVDGKHHVIPIVTGGDEMAEEVDVPEILPILTLRSSVLFPGSITPITVGRDKSISLVRAVNAEGGILGAVLQRESDVEDPAPDDMYKVGTAARIIKILEMPNGNLTVILNGLEKIEIKEYVSVEPYFKARVTPLRDSTPDLKSIEFEALVDSVRDVALGIINVSPNMPKEAAFAIKNIDSKRGIINFICSNLELSDEDRQSLLEAPGLLARARKLLEILIREQQLAELKSQIQERVKQEIDKQQRDYYLQQQMRTIQDELGDGEDADIEKMREQAAKKNWPKEVAETFEKELSKVERLNPAVAEYSVQMTYLQLMLDLPWNEVTQDNLDLEAARARLDHDHFGLEEVKDRLLEHLAVIKLKGDLKSPILCLYGPPGVGKTSLGKSVAAALGRKFGRISLGGLHDESEIRGHRRTYIGAMPGRIIQTIKRCGSSNPVIILDEVDKVTVSNHGDPSSALLEVLDPEQNTTFHDNYLDMEYDLSKVLFIATANNVGNIAPALRDRMEMINIAGYLMEEKVRIALDHLLPKQRAAHGIGEEQLTLTPEVVECIVAGYTREAGVRSLDKHLAKIARARAKQIAFGERFEPALAAADVEKILGMPKFLREEYEVADMVGVVTGLAWTEVGGDILYVESVLTPGKGKLSLTGNLGDVMKESATIAHEWVMAHHKELGIDPAMFAENDIDIHVPEGAIPKDGPSAGITMVTSIVSTYTGRKVKERIAMTGETTLRGRVMPVGGVKEKILAAKRAGITELILSEDNRKDIAEIKPEYIAGLTFHYVRNNSDVLRLALQ
ncbi:MULTISPECIES: endopeptidase La [unclassified Alistipes]|uniref:endopeptidase La n=1 Tax=unclassified Alistipes TaxID=2608932 RepID=UPI0007A92713|nr:MULTISPECIES: endopeptidase La [unclassified Alistipes]CVI66508.1 Lon protease 2 [Alistipes sp. CHKCI003]HJC76380.1 endopeptidase La [Candidatus Alistipes excrementavium]